MDLPNCTLDTHLYYVIEILCFYFFLREHILLRFWADNFI
jgi:hypothetical protein